MKGTGGHMELRKVSGQDILTMHPSMLVSLALDMKSSLSSVHWIYSVVLQNEGCQINHWEDSLALDSIVSRSSASRYSTFLIGDCLIAVCAFVLLTLISGGDFYILH
jgi:hypothetical protein